MTKYYSYIEKRPDTMGNLLLPDDAPQLDDKRREKTKLEERQVLGRVGLTLCVCMHSKRENSSGETWAPVSLVDGKWRRQ